MLGRVRKDLAGRLPIIRARAKVHAREQRVERLERLVGSLKRRAEQPKRRVGSLKQRVRRFDHRVRKLEARLESLKPARAESIVWIFGSGRSGTSWLANMVSEALEAPLWFEPRLGNVFHANIPKNKGWLPGVRRFVLEGARHRFGKPQRLVIKETSGCIGAPTLSEALPESRLLVIVRDPRDVVASWLDAKRKEGWSTKKGGQKYDRHPDSLAIFLAKRYKVNVENALAAFESHRGPKALIFYEELRHNTTQTLARALSDLGLDVSSERVETIATQHAFESVPAEEKGPGKFRRKAQPGSWREDLQRHS
jgi:Sulfotransferase domain